MPFDNINPVASMNQAVNGPLGYTQPPGPPTSMPNQGLQQQIHVNVPGRGLLNPAQSDSGISMVSLLFMLPLPLNRGSIEGVLYLSLFPFF